MATTKQVLDLVEKQGQEIKAQGKAIKEQGLAIKNHAADCAKESKETNDRLKTLEDGQREANELLAYIRGRLDGRMGFFEGLSKVRIIAIAVIIAILQAVFTQGIDGVITVLDNAFDALLHSLPFL